MRRSGFTLTEVLVALMLIILLVLVITSTSSSMIRFQNVQERQIAGNEYLFFLRKTVHSHKSGNIILEDFYSDNTDRIAEAFYDNFSTATHFPHQYKTPTHTKIGNFYVNHFFLQHSDNLTDRSTETIFTASVQE